MGDLSDRDDYEVIYLVGDGAWVVILMRLLCSSLHAASLQLHALRPTGFRICSDRSIRIKAWLRLHCVSQ